MDEGGVGGHIGQSVNQAIHETHFDVNVMELIILISTDFSDLVLLILRLLSSQCNVWSS